MVTGPYAVQFCGVGPMSLAQGYGSGHTERRRAGRGGRLPRGPVAFPNPVEVAGEDLLEFPRAGGDVVPSRVLERLRVLLAKQIEEGPARPRRDLLIRCPIHVEGREAEISLADARRTSTENQGPDGSEAESARYSAAAVAPCEKPRIPSTGWFR
eukprot:CAMPEP_0177618424 /NCGR_PEP_ID=MMETSP0419_2-20121207/25567_1 /TAXON_ID=582737 /ORGANISM="Tetraselmis sp., Strain GSL018" /LENGTH=154 /DNA_ID=CAMNT_0019117319 /DNA_START=40 /DNA_END=504 /DNA_ORIENTATION=-